eukprot:6524162-Prymnesium_polylepis.1
MLPRADSMPRPWEVEEEKAKATRAARKLVRERQRVASVHHVHRQRVAMLNTNLRQFQMSAQSEHRIPPNQLLMTSASRSGSRHKPSVHHARPQGARPVSPTGSKRILDFAWTALEEPKDARAHFSAGPTYCLLSGSLSSAHSMSSPQLQSYRKPPPRPQSAGTVRAGAQMEGTTEEDPTASKRSASPPATASSNAAPPENNATAAALPVAPAAPEPPKPEPEPEPPRFSSSGSVGKIRFE